MKLTPDQLTRIERERTGTLHLHTIDHTSLRSATTTANSWFRVGVNAVIKRKYDPWQRRELFDVWIGGPIDN